MGRSKAKGGSQWPIEGIHCRMEKDQGEGGGGAQEAEGEAGKEEGNQSRAGEEAQPSPEGWSWSRQEEVCCWWSRWRCPQRNDKDQGTAAFGGNTGFYARELAKSRASSVERASSVAAQSSLARATRASSVPPTTGFAGRSGYYGQQLSALDESHESSSATSTSINTSSTSKFDSSMTAQELSIKQGRQSTSRAVRRAELHASSSGRDPRHVGVPRDTSDDICYKVADLRMTPFESRELQSQTEANMRGRLRVQKLEKELSALTSSAMKYKSFYSKSAAQMAREAIEASESEAAASKSMRKTTIVESSKQVAAA